ncbi:hypothetical protein, partial [Thiolapillus sp.]|uniref:hypothetical protein n=1 Tax=Thiolapillus sp. TaxID=2017437 RepID=UPI003AF521AD
ECVFHDYCLFFGFHFLNILFFFVFVNQIFVFCWYLSGHFVQLLVFGCLLVSLPLCWPLCRSAGLSAALLASLPLCWPLCRSAGLSAALLAFLPFCWRAACVLVYRATAASLFLCLPVPGLLPLVVTLPLHR